MEPLDTDVDYPTYQPRPISSHTRFNWLLVFPIIGLLLIVLFILAAIFQFDLSVVVNTLVGFMILFFVLIVVGLFWAFAARANTP